MGRVGRWRVATEESPNASQLDVSGYPVEVTYEVVAAARGQGDGLGQLDRASAMATSTAAPSSSTCPVAGRPGPCHGRGAEHVEHVRR